MLECPGYIVFYDKELSIKKRIAGDILFKVSKTNLYNLFHKHNILPVMFLLLKLIMYKNAGCSYIKSSLTRCSGPYNWVM